MQGVRARFLGAVRRAGVRELHLKLGGTKITTTASMREVWAAVWQGNAATLEELYIGDDIVGGYQVSKHQQQQTS